MDFKDIKVFRVFKNNSTQMQRLTHSIYFALSVLLFLSGNITAQTTDYAAYIRDNYTKTEVMVPMRDGIKLFTSIYAPKDNTKSYPILLKRTPYSCSPYGTDQFPTTFQNMNLAESGYIFVFQDVRGKYMSEGDFVDVRPFLPKPVVATPVKVEKKKKR